jgi:hypothetical protein
MSLSLRPRHSSTPLLFSADSKPYGLAFPEWTSRWWQWLLQQPRINNAGYDQTGENCANNQYETNVWFLAGTYGGSTKRECSIPTEKAILLPIINYECSFADEPELKTESALIKKAKAEIDDISRMEVTFDGIKLNHLKNYRVRSPVFDVTLRNDNVFEGKAGPTKAVSDGYWLFFSPLPPGNHELHTTGSCLNGTINIETEFRLTVI